MGEPVTVRQLLKRKADTLTESEISEVLDYIHSLEARGQDAERVELSDDDVVNFLTNALENRRARGVVEWEKTRRKAASAASRRSI